MTRGEIDLIPIEFKARRKLSLNLGMHREITQKYLYKQMRQTEVYKLCGVNMHENCLLILTEASFH